MPLVKPLDPQHNAEVKKLSDFFNETLGFCPNSVLTMQVRPKIAKAFIELNMAVMENKGTLTSGLKRLIGYVTSQVAGCQYCKAHTILAAERYGCTQQQLNNVWEYKTHSSFSEAERAALDFSIAASTIPNGVDDEIKNNLKKYWNDGEVIEMLGVISLFGYLNRWNDSMGTTMEEGAIDAGNKYLGSNNWNVGKHK